MDLDRLEEFIVIAQHKSIKKAGDSLSLSPATLRARLSAFEASLNTTLFLREKGDLILTESGSRLYSNAIAIVSRYRSLKSELKYLSQEEYRTLRIAVVGSGLPFYLGPFLDQICKSFPNIRLDIVDDHMYSIEEGLLSGNIDLYFAPAISKKRHKDIAHFSLAVAHQYIIIPKTHPKARNASVTLKDLEHETFILYPETKESCIRDFQLENLKASGISYSVYESDTATPFYPLLVPIGKGILLTPVHAIDDLPNCTTLPVTNITFPAPSTLFYKRGSSKPEVHYFINGFTKFIKETVAHEYRKTI